MLFNKNALQSLQLRTWNPVIIGCLSAILIYLMYFNGEIVIKNLGQLEDYIEWSNIPWNSLLITLGATVTLIGLWIKQIYYSKKFVWFVVTFLSFYFGYMLADFFYYAYNMLQYRYTWQELLFRVSMMFWVRFALTPVVLFMITKDFRNTLLAVCPLVLFFCVLLLICIYIDANHLDPMLNLILLAIALLFFFFPLFTMRLASVCATMIVLFVSAIAYIVNGVIRR